MRIRGLLLTTVICSGLLGTAGMLQSQAEAATVLQPNSSWNVSQIASRNPSSKPYCALARRFNNNMVVTMARNSRDETSLAIDFQQNKFSTSNSYDINLSPGFDQDRLYQVRPVSGRAVVVRLGKDYAFMDAFGRSGRLGININGENYSFNFPDMTQGQMKLNECLVSIIEPAAGDDDSYQVASAAMVPPQPVPASRVTGVATGSIMPPPELTPVPSSARPVIPVSAEPIGAVPAPVAPPVVSQAPAAPSVNPELVRQLEGLREDNLRLRNALERERRHYEERLMREGQDSSMMSELNEKVQMLQIENNELKYKISSVAMEQSSPKAAPVCEPEVREMVPTEMKAELSMLQKENQMLKGSLAQQTAQIAQLEKEVNEKGVVTEDGSALASLQKTVMDLQAENAGLRESLTVAQKNQGTSPSPVTLAQLRSVEAQLRAVEQDRNKLLSQLDGIHKGKQDGLLSIATDNWNLEQATRRYNEAELEIRRLGRMLEEQRASCDRDKKELEYMLFDPEIATQEQISKLIDLEEQVKAADLKIAAAEKMAGNQNQELVAELAALRKEIQFKDQMAYEAEAKVAELQNEISRQQRLASNAQSNGIKPEELQTARREIVDLEHKASSLKIEKDHLQTEKIALGQKVASLEAQLEHAQRVADDSINSVDMAVLQREKGDLLQQIAVLQSQVQVQQTEKTQLSGQISSLQQELQIAKSNLANGPSEAEVYALRNDRETMTQKVAALETQLQQAQVSLQSAPSAGQLETIKAEKNELGHQVASLKQELASLQETVRSTPSMAEYQQVKSERDQIAQKLASAKTAPVVQTQADVASQFAQIEPAAGVIEAEPLGEQPIIQTRKPVVAAVSSPVEIAPEFSKRPAAIAALDKEINTSTIRASSQGFMNASQFQTMLSKANISVSGGVREIGGQGRPDFVAFGWESGGLYGSAEQHAMNGANSFDSHVKTYLDKTASRCGGQFAAVPALDENSGSLRVSAYEIACVGSVSAAASVVFYGQGSTFTIVAHEAGVESMDMTMEMRDRLLDGLLNSQIAMR